ncbi:MAG TPA: hypothetical protein VIQ02_01590 [Jiangellaceae bacterium]
MPELDQSSRTHASAAIEGRTALLWPGYDLSLHTLALDMMHADFDLVTGLLEYPDTVQIVGAKGASSAAVVVLRYPDAFHRRVGQVGLSIDWRSDYVEARELPSRPHDRAAMRCSRPGNCRAGRCPWVL